jgi:hypothetical protein
MNKLFVTTNDWFKASLLALNLKKNPLPFIQDKK